MSLKCTEKDILEFQQNTVWIEMEGTLRGRIFAARQSFLRIDPNNATEIARAQQSIIENENLLNLPGQLLLEVAAEEMKDGLDKPSNFTDPRDVAGGATSPAPSIG